MGKMVAGPICQEGRPRGPSGGAKARVFPWDLETTLQTKSIEMKGKRHGEVLGMEPQELLGV